MPAPRALIVGGSAGGLFAASLLRRIGWDVVVFERSTGDLAGRGAGVGSTQELLDLMRVIGAPFDPTIGVPIRSLGWLDADGTLHHDMPRVMLPSAWGRIYAPLRKVLPDAFYRSGIAVTRVEQDANSVTAVFADGSHATGDLLVAADGTLSTIRRQFLPDVQPRYAGYIAWRGMLDAQDLEPATRDIISGRLVFSFPDGEMMLTMPTPGVGEDLRPGHQRCYFIWYRPVAENDLPDLFTDTTGRNYGVSIPPPLIRRELIARMNEDARAIFAPSVASVVNKVKEPLLQAISDLECPNLAFGRVAIIGDAAFVARPHVAGGITKAALDAKALADALAATGNDVPAAIMAYDAKQRDFGGKLVAHSRYLGAYLEGRTKPPAERRGPEASRDPLDILRQYGAPHLLRDPDPAGRGPDARKAVNS